MTNPTPLSPAAQAVWNAAWANTPVQCGDIEGTRRAQVAAALRAAADQVSPSEDCPKRTPGCDMRQFQDRWSRWHQASLAQHQLLAIAAELEGAQ